MPKKAKNPTPAQKKRVPLTKADDLGETLGPLEEAEILPVGMTDEESQAWMQARIDQAKAWQATATPEQLAAIARFKDKQSSARIGPITGPGGTPLDGTPGQAEPTEPPRA